MRVVHLLGRETLLAGDLKKQKGAPDDDQCVEQAEMHGARRGDDSDQRARGHVQGQFGAAQSEESRRGELS